MMLYDEENNKIILLDDYNISYVSDMHHESDTLCYIFMYLRVEET